MWRRRFEKSNELDMEKMLGHGFSGQDVYEKW